MPPPRGEGGTPTPFLSKNFKKFESENPPKNLNVTPSSVSNRPQGGECVLYSKFGVAVTELQIAGEGRGTVPCYRHTFLLGLV